MKRASPPTHWLDCPLDHDKDLLDPFVWPWLGTLHYLRSSPYIITHSAFVTTQRGPAKAVPRQPSQDTTSLIVTRPTHILSRLRLSLPATRYSLYVCGTVGGSYT